MGIERFFTTELTFLRPTAVESARYNSTSPGWDDADPFTETGWFYQDDSQEVVEGRDTEQSTWTFITRAAAPITAECRATYGGLVYEVDGRPKSAPGPDGPHHLRVRLRLVREVPVGA